LEEFLNGTLIGLAFLAQVVLTLLPVCSYNKTTEGVRKARKLAKA